MPNTIKATILGFSSLYPKAQALSFNVPFDNTIRILGWDDILTKDKIYYGDEIDLNFWKLLQLPFGESSSSDIPLTLQENYLYKYYHNKKIFDVYDNNGVRILHKTNIESIADLNIDFSIHKSHQFWIIVGGVSDGHVFMFPAIMRKDRLKMDLETCFDTGVQNIYLPDRVRPYLPDDIDNPSWAIKYLAFFNSGNGKDKGIEWGGTNSDLIENKVLHIDTISALGDYNAINWVKNCPNNYFYSKGLHELEVHYDMDIKDARMFGMFSLLYMQLAIGMYPDLMPIERYDETQNNRPIYEPWLIWGFYKFVWLKHTEDDDDTITIPLFDLSPMFA